MHTPIPIYHLLIAVSLSQRGVDERAGQLVPDHAPSAGQHMARW